MTGPEPMQRLHRGARESRLSPRRFHSEETQAGPDFKGAPISVAAFEGIAL